jgi:hypothetical protein
MGPPTSVLSDLVSRLRLEAGGFSYRPPYAVSPGRPSPGMAFLPRPAIGDSGGYVECHFVNLLWLVRLYNIAVATDNRVAKTPLVSKLSSSAGRLDFVYIVLITIERGGCYTAPLPRRYLLSLPRSIFIG